MGLFHRAKDERFFEQLTEIAGNLIEGTDILAKLMALPPAQRDAERNDLHAVENSSDDLTHAFMNKINQTFVTPLDRDDLSELAYRLDDCMDLIDEAGNLIVVYQLQEIPAVSYTHLTLPTSDLV